MISITSISGFLTASVLPLSLLAIGTLLVLFVAIPYKKIQSYKGEGVTTYFFPVLGVFHKLQQALKHKGDVQSFLKESSKTMPNPKYMVSHINRTPYIILQDPKYIKEFLLKPNAYCKTHFIDVLRPLVGNGLVSAEGETWKHHRKIISASFNFEFLKTNIPLIQNTTKEFFNKLTSEDYKNYSAISRVQDITGEIVGRIFFGEHLNNYTIEGKPLTLALAELTSELSFCGLDPLVIMFGAKILDVPFIPKYKRIMQRVKNFRNVCFKIVNDRKAKPQSAANDLLSSLLATQKSEDVENRFSDEDIVDEFITFFIAGMDTTGHLIGMTLYNLTQYPQHLAQLQKERDATYNLKGELTTEMLSKMDVLHSVLKETLRFYAPAPQVFPRKALFDHEILDIKVHKGDIVNASFFAPAFNDKYMENPQQFDPSRWINPESKIDSYAFTPFSAGPRNCIGQHLAIIEAKVIVSEFLERFDFSLKEGYQLKLIWRFLYEPVDELFLQVQPKQK